MIRAKLTRPNLVPENRKKPTCHKHVSRDGQEGCGSIRAYYIGVSIYRGSYLLSESAAVAFLAGMRSFARLIHNRLQTPFAACSGEGALFKSIWVKAVEIGVL